MWHRNKSVVFVFLKDYNLDYIKINHMIAPEDVYPVQHIAGKKTKNKFRTNSQNRNVTVI
jgi:hypothetical protein